MNLYDVRKEAGSFEFTFTTATYNPEAGAEGQGQTITLINTKTAEAVTVWLNPNPNALYPQDPDKTDGMRLFRALGRKFAGSGETLEVEDLMAKASENGGTLVVRLNQMKSGHNAWLWTVN